MFKKNPNRPSLNISFKKTSQGYKVLPNESFQLFTTKKIVRSIYRPDLIQMSSQHIEGVGNSGGLASGTIIQPPSHITIPAVSSWFKQDEIHEIQRENFPEYFRPQVNEEVFSFAVKNANLYMFYRNSMIFMWRENAKKYLSPTHCRKNLLGDVSSIMRIHAFLQNWGLINFPSKEHNKGFTVSKSETLVCYVCQTLNSKHYFVAEIQEVLFQICSHCFQNDFYPQSIKKTEFRKILYENHTTSQKDLDRNQIIRMLEIINGIPNGVPREKDRDAWSVIQKEFPGIFFNNQEISKEKILKTFLKIPLNVEMNSNIFENNEDVLIFQNSQIRKQIQTIQQPSVFEDFQNSILGSVAYMYYKISEQNLKQKHREQEALKYQEETLKIEEEQDADQLQELQLYRNILQASEQHCMKLTQDQEGKIRDLTKMLVDIVLSRLELKTLFISEYRKLVNAEEDVSKNIYKNNLAEYLKNTLRSFESSCEFQHKKQENGFQQQEKEIKMNGEQIWDQNDLDL